MDLALNQARCARGYFSINVNGELWDRPIKLTYKHSNPSPGVPIYP